MTPFSHVQPAFPGYSENICRGWRFVFPVACRGYRRTPQHYWFLIHSHETLGCSLITEKVFGHGSPVCGLWSNLSGLLHWTLTECLLWTKPVVSGTGSSIWFCTFGSLLSTCPLLLNHSLHWTAWLMTRTWPHGKPGNTAFHGSGRLRFTKLFFTFELHSHLSRTNCGAFVHSVGFCIPSTCHTLYCGRRM